MYKFLFSVVLIIISTFTLPASSDVAKDIKNFGNDLKLMLDNIQPLIIDQNKKVTTSLDSAQTKLVLFEIDQQVNFLFTNQTFEKCGVQNNDFTTNFKQIFTKLDNIDDIIKVVKKIEVEDQTEQDKVQNAQKTINNVFLKISATENSLNNAMQIHVDTQNRKLTDFENKITNSLDEIKNEHQTYLDKVKEMENNIEEILIKILNIEKQDINLSIEDINKAILDDENDQNNKFAQLLFKISAIESDQKIYNDLHQKNSKIIDDMESDLPNLINEMNDIKSRFKNGQNQLLNSLNSEITNVKKEVSGQNSNSQKTQAIENSLKKIDDIKVKVQNSEASLTNVITNTGQSIQTAMNTLQTSVSNIQQSSLDGKKIQDIYRIADYMKRVACDHPWITSNCNSNYF